ncbi:hypothetical protein [Candidatus Enterococcus ferrettii]|uniref:ABC transporter permease n=1 Tax=Candidatus Enterococcus ferrettii TaxID=2815324 RepID=A0ABV0ETM9_9ENTE|nr:hypothetical protein [Enterococcus sp. 665A]MBO1341169.1 hypothetical protein [Enterococcus sp. 665A]
MEKINKLNLYFFRFHYMPFVLVTIIFLLLFPFLFGAEYLESAQTAFIVERVFTIIGIFLFIPLYLPDTQKEIVAVVRAKQTSYMILLLIRLGQILCMGLIALALFLGTLKFNHSQFNFQVFFFAEFATVFFLGGLLSISYTFFHHIIPSTMIAVMYYVMNMFSNQKYLGPFYLFTLAENDWESKILLFLVGLFLIVSSVLLTTYQRNSV